MRQQHRALYAQIPSFTCKPGCSDCCGPVPVSRWEADRLGIEGPLTPTKPGTTTCAFVGDCGECTVYDKRPFLCRLFGTTADKRMACPHGCGPARLVDGAALTRRYIPLVEERGR